MTASQLRRSGTNAGSEYERTAKRAKKCLRNSKEIGRFYRREVDLVTIIPLRTFECEPFDGSPLDIDQAIAVTGVIIGKLQHNLETRDRKFGNRKRSFSSLAIAHAALEAELDNMEILQKRAQS